MTAEPFDRRADEGSAVSIREMILDHDRKLDSILAWRSELRGAMALVKIAFGTSIVSGIASILAIIGMLGIR